MKDMTALSKYQREFLERIISIPSVGGDPEEGTPYRTQPKRVLETFLDEAGGETLERGTVPSFQTVPVSYIELGRLIQRVGDIPAVFLSLADAFREQIFDLPVYGTKIILCPLGNSIV